jgi:hypothetical protein
MSQGLSRETAMLYTVSLRFASDFLMTNPEVWSCELADIIPQKGRLYIGYDIYMLPAPTMI